MAEDIVQKVKAAGVVGAGGAGFPTHVKIAAKVDTIIANGAECEPLLHCDEHLMAAHPDLVMQGLRLVMQSTGAERGIIALKREHHDAIQALQQLLEKQQPAKSQQPPIALHLIEISVYPAGDEFVLVYDVTGRMVPEVGLPLDVGCVVQNVGTLANIARAVYEGRPVTHRYLTVTGAVRVPKTVRVPIGMSFGDVLNLAGGVTLPVGEYKVVVGGPMMGRLAKNLDEPVTKTTTGLIPLPVDNAVVRYMSRPLRGWIKRGQSTCDQCRDCTMLCPRYLLGHDFRPHEVMRATAYGITELSDIITGAVLCCECRLCEAYACPLELSPMAFYRDNKRKLSARGYRRLKRADLTAHPFRESRRVPTERLVSRLGLREYHERPCVLDEGEVLPARVVIPLKQHLGVPATPIVSVGDLVQAGDLIANIPEDKLGANVHASISGRVAEVTEQFITITA